VAGKDKEQQIMKISKEKFAMSRQTFLVT